jgi:hypothetical protein
MKKLVALSAILLSATLASVAAAQESDKPAPPREGRPDRAAMRERLLKEFDADGDGKLSDEERAKARESRGAREGDRGDGRRGREGRPPRPEGRGHEGPGGPRPGWRGPDGPPPGGHGGPHRPGFPPNPMRLFKEFDADKNDQLSGDEFEKLMGKLHELGRPGHGPGPGGPGGPPESRRRGGPEGRPPRPRDGERGPEGRRHGPSREDAAKGDDAEKPKADVDAVKEKDEDAAEGDDATA